MSAWRPPAAQTPRLRSRRESFCSPCKAAKGDLKGTIANNERIKVAVLGASGYTGAEVIRLGANHPHMEITQLTAERAAGKQFEDVFPSLAPAAAGTMVKIGDVNFDDIDAAFCCLPHATTQEVLAGLPEHVKVVDLSADFRLRDVDTYAEWYGGEHKAPELQKEAVYGLTELHRAAVADARLVANPGCYPTSVQLPLVPLLKAGLISSEGIIIDAKSGVSGAGRAAKEGTLFCEITEGMQSYGVSRHRHMPEIEQGLADAAGGDVRVSFTPHLIPMSRGMQSTMYVQMADGATVDGLRDALAEAYKEEYFVRVLAAGQMPQTRHVRGSNFCLVGLYEDRLQGRAIVISVIDNVCKGASGQAIQNLNVMMGCRESTAIDVMPVFP
eukprot:jgi/Ulvmu1/9041/UM005_0134.1